MTYHTDDATLSPADHSTIAHNDALGRIVQNGDDYDVWDPKGEYLGGFTSYQAAYMALIEAQSVHQALADAYNHR